MFVENFLSELNAYTNRHIQYTCNYVIYYFHFPCMTAFVHEGFCCPGSYFVGKGARRKSEGHRVDRVPAPRFEFLLAIHCFVVRHSF